MNKSINYFCGLLCMLLCAGLGFASCTEVPLDDTGSGTTDTKVLASITLVSITETTASFAGRLNISAGDLAFSHVALYYSNAKDFNMNTAESVIQTSFDEDRNFTISLNNLKPNTTYRYCILAEVRSEKTYGEVLEFKTLQYPYDTQHDLNISSASDLSAVSSANCYIVSKGGLYKFKTVKGNSAEQVNDVSYASILWESFGTSVAPRQFDLIKAICYKDGYIAFQTADIFKEGNAVISAKDTDGNILWSWHIWMTDEPKRHEYYNNAGIMMDRNLGATSATPGDVSALGLLYQWGRKDPFLGASSIHSNKFAKSTISWPSGVKSNHKYGTVEFATSHPTTYIDGNDYNWDWYYDTCSNVIYDTRWVPSNESKTIFDPCPPGWRVADGGVDGVWAKAVGSSSPFDYPFDGSNKGMNFSGKFGSASTIWYPASGWIQGVTEDGTGILDKVGSYGSCWSASANLNLDNVVYDLSFYPDRVRPSQFMSYATAQPVRCQLD